MIRPQPRSTLFPYTTLFRSVTEGEKPIIMAHWSWSRTVPLKISPRDLAGGLESRAKSRSEEHTSELQSRGHLVCRLLLEKKKKKNKKKKNKKLKKILICNIL